MLEAKLYNLSVSSMSHPHIIPRPAATLILARDCADGFEVFLMQRTHQAVFMPGVFVFPGGAVDLADAHEDVCAYCDMDDAAANALLGVEKGGLAYLVAAVRECFEEAGLLLAVDGSGEMVDLSVPERAERYADYRRRMAAGELTLAELCRREDLRLAVDKLGFFSHWVTPPGPPRRYDTRFFTAVAPLGQVASHDGEEMVAHTWLTPADALERHAQGILELPRPTIRTLKALARFKSSAELMAYSMVPREVEPTTPRVAIGSAGERIFERHDPVYAELAKVDPDNTGRASYEIVPGVVTRVSERVRRVTAPNPSYMTGPGTNTYLIEGREGIAVIDPGPAIEAHVERVLEIAGGRIRWILATHTHMDHSPAAQQLREATGAQVLGMPAPALPHQDQSFQPDRVLGHGERLDLGGCVLRAIHTPGHASNHLCFLLEEERLLFTGDHIMQGSTVVISPPDGDMRAYLESLHALQEEEIDYLAPAHGFLMDKPDEVIERIISHRMEREAKVMRAIRELGSGTEEELLPVAYSDTSPRLYPVAIRSLQAHLIKLRADGRVIESDGRWSLAG